MILSSSRKNDLTYLYYRCTTCKIQVSEESISEQFFSKFDSMMKKEHFEEELNRLIVSHDADRLMLLTYEMYSGGQNSEEIMDQINCERSEYKIYVQLVKLLQDKIQSTKFEKAGFAAKRKFLLDHVKMIEYDYRKKKLSIEFQSEENANDGKHDNE